MPRQRVVCAPWITSETPPALVCGSQEAAKVDGQGHVTDSGNNTFRGLRTHNLAYFEFTDPYRDWHFRSPTFYELYNLTVDPEQMTNIYHSSPTALVQELGTQLRELYGCSGTSCM